MLSGMANSWPFLFKGLEKEFTDPGPFYYSGSGQFYSPQLVRSLSQVGQTSSSGPGGGGFSPAGRAISPPSGSSGGLSPQSVGNDSQQALQVGTDIYVGTNALTPILGPEVPALAVPLAIVGDAIDFVVNFFEDIFGGGSSAEIPRQLLYGRHPLNGGILGIQENLIPDERPSAPNPRTPKPGRGGVPKTGVLRVFVETLPFQEVTPFEGEAVPAPLDKAPYWFGRPVTFSRCLDAAEDQVLWEDLCRDMPNSVLKQGCWSKVYKPIEEKRNFCKDLFEV